MLDEYVQNILNFKIKTLNFAILEAVPISEHQEIETKNTELEQTNLKLRHEVEQLKEVALISMNQHQNLEDQLNDQSTEIQNLREQMTELESKDDSKANLAQLHRLVTRIQVSPLQSSHIYHFSFIKSIDHISFSRILNYMTVRKLDYFSFSGNYE